MRPTWTTEPFTNALGGVSSAVDPRFLQPDQLSWGKNVALRGGFPGTRPAFRQRLLLPAGLYQGGGYFSVQNGMIVISVAGQIYRLRIGNDAFSYETIPLDFINSPVLTQCWMTQTVESLIIQDGQSRAIIYNGSSVRRSSPASFEVPLGRQMAYGNGRLWVAINQFNVVAGDIRTDAYQSELKFTETTYLSGGGALYFPRGVNGLAFFPTTGGGDYGTLMIFGVDFADSIRADISSRDLWAQMPGFVTTALRNIGVASQNAIVEVNQDLYWRDNNGGIRSLRSAVSDESGPGNAPISREVSRLIDFESHQLLNTCSGVYFGNRLLMTASPYLNISGGISYKNIISLDFAPISTMAGKSTPIYDGQWEGLSAAQIISGKFNGQTRAFVISADEDGQNRLWEIMANKTIDLSQQCVDGEATDVETPILCQVEYPRRTFGDIRSRKRLIRLDAYVTDLSDDATLTAYWRTDNDLKWREWPSAGPEFCAKVTDPTSTTPHVFKNLSTQQRPQIKSFTIPDSVDVVTNRETNVGFEFQFKLVWSGSLKLYMAQVHAEVLKDLPYAEEIAATCVSEDLTGNEVNYEIVATGCPPPDPLYELDTTGVDDLAATYSMTEGVTTAYQVRNQVTTNTFVGIGIYSSTGGTQRTLEHTIAASDFTQGDIIDITAWVTQGRCFFSLILAFNNFSFSGDWPVNAAIITQLGGVTETTFTGMADPPNPLYPVRLVTVPGSTFIRDEKDFGGVTIPSIAHNQFRVSLAAALAFPPA